MVTNPGGSTGTPLTITGGAPQTLTTQQGNELLIGTAVGTYLDLTSNIIVLDQVLRNGVAGNETATATAGGGVALPATVAGFLTFQDHLGTARKLPYYAV